MRICSLLPSATEIVFALGLQDQLVAVTHECDYPPQASAQPVITRSIIDHAGRSSRDIHQHVSESIRAGGSIYDIDTDLLKEVDPDIILTQELCEVCAVSYDEVEKATRLLDGERQIISLEPTTLNGILETIDRVGQIADVTDRSAKLVGELRNRIEEVASVARTAASRPSVLALEWLDPPFVGGHWIPEMIDLAGGKDVLGREAAASAPTVWDSVINADPDMIVLMPCGFDLGRTLEEARGARFPDGWQGLGAVRSNSVYAVDGSAYFSRSGPRVVDGLEVLAEIIHPELFPRKFPPEAWVPVAAAEL